MLEAMSIVAAVAMVVLLLRIRRHRVVAHNMWVKMVGMEFEIDRLRDLLRHSCVQMGCACEFHPEGYTARGVEYVDTVTDKMIHDLAMKMAHELTCYMRPLVLQGLERSRLSQFASEMHFRIPMIRADFRQATCYIVSKMPGMAPIEIVSERDHQRKAWEEHMEVEHFRDVLDSLHVDMKAILQNIVQLPTTR